MASTSQNFLDRPNPTQPLAPASTRAILLFAYMQALDILSTLAFLMGGVEEANPLVRAAMQAAGSPLAGLVAVKLLGMAMGIYCWRSGRVTLLERANVFFALLVAYNLCCLIAGLSAR